MVSRGRQITATAVGLTARLPNDPGQQPASLFHLLRMTFIHLVARFHNHHVAMILLADMTDVLHAVGDDVVGFQFRIAHQSL